MLKRAIDILCAAACLAVLGLPMLLLAAAIRLTSPGPAIFRQRRAGWMGAPFVMFKFRTMRSDVDPYGISPHAADDPRLTRLGRFLRETSLDELPQVFNVLRGDMSLVGPRPLYERQAEQWNDRQRRRLNVRPGLTGYAQVYGRGNLSHEDKIDLDVYYVDNCNLMLDLKIILSTVALMALPGKDIYERRYSRYHERETDRKA